MGRMRKLAAGSLTGHRILAGARTATSACAIGVVADPQVSAGQGREMSRPVTSSAPDPFTGCTRLGMGIVR